MALIKLVILFKKLGNLPLIFVGSLLRWYSHQCSNKTFVNGVSHTAFLSRQSFNKSVQRGRPEIRQCFPFASQPRARLLNKRLTLWAIRANGCRSTSGSAQTALSRCQRRNAKFLDVSGFQAAAAASRHVLIVAARSARCVRAEVRWRWILNVL